MTLKLAEPLIKKIPLVSVSEIVAFAEIKADEVGKMFVLDPVAPVGPVAPVAPCKP